MANVYPVDVFATAGDFTVHIEGLDRLLASLATLDPNLKKYVEDEIRHTGQKVLRDTKANAGAFRRTGQFQRSFRMRNRKSGIRIESSDPGAGAIEFANPGAVYLRGVRYGQEFPAVKRAGKPRALIKAVVENEQYVLERVQYAIQLALDEVRGV